MALSKEDIAKLTEEQTNTWFESLDLISELERRGNIIQSKIPLQEIVLAFESKRIPRSEANFNQAQKDLHKLLSDLETIQRAIDEINSFRNQIELKYKNMEGADKKEFEMLYQKFEIRVTQITKSFPPGLEQYKNFLDHRAQSLKTPLAKDLSPLKEEINEFASLINDLSDGLKDFIKKSKSKTKIKHAEKLLKEVRGWDKKFQEMCVTLQAASDKDVLRFEESIKEFSSTIIKTLEKVQKDLAKEKFNSHYGELMKKALTRLHKLNEHFISKSHKLILG